VEEEKQAPMSGRSGTMGADGPDLPVVPEEDFFFDRDYGRLTPT
jgi:hypothetical protein